MWKVIALHFVIGVCGIVNALPTSQPTAQSFQTGFSGSALPSSTPVPSATVKPSVGTTSPVVSGSPPIIMGSPPLDVSRVETNGFATVKNLKEEPTTGKPATSLTSIQKAEATTSHGDIERQSAVTGSKVDTPNVSTPSLPMGNHSTTTSTLKDRNNTTPPSRQQLTPVKTSTTYVNEGKVVVFNGICGPDGCAIEGDIYDDIVPVIHKK